MHPYFPYLTLSQSYLQAFLSFHIYIKRKEALSLKHFSLGSLLLLRWDNYQNLYFKLDQKKKSYVIDWLRYF